MKKIFLFILTFLIFCTAGQAKIIDLHNCYLKAHKDWKMHSEMRNLEDLIYSVDTTARTMTRLRIYADTEAELRMQQSGWEKGKEDWIKFGRAVEEYKKAFPYPDNIPKYNKRIFKLTNISGGIATGEDVNNIDENLIFTVNINLNSGEVETYIYDKKNKTTTNISYFYCKKNK